MSFFRDKDFIITTFTIICLPFIFLYHRKTVSAINVVCLFCTCVLELKFLKVLR